LADSGLLVSETEINMFYFKFTAKKYVEVEVVWRSFAIPVYDHTK